MNVHRDMTTDPIVTEDHRAAMEPGVQVLIDPERADALGLVEETAINAIDAWESNNDEVEG